MATYGRNFEFRVPPHGGQRGARYAAPTTGSRLPIGTPIGAVNGAAETALGLRPVELLTAGVAPKPGVHGILVFELDPGIGVAGEDPFLTTYSDYDTVPLGKAVQMVSGTEVKVVFKNTSDRTFLETRDYTGRTMVAGVGATPTVAVGDYLHPGPGTDDTSGYWQEGAAANAWLVVTKVDSARDEVEARMLF